MCKSGKPNSQIVIYQTESGQTKIEVRLQGETVWLTHELLAELFQKVPELLTSASKTFLMKTNWMQSQLSGNSG